jgi:hypothetical protein
VGIMRVVMSGCGRRWLVLSRLDSGEDTRESTGGVK